MKKIIAASLLLILVFSICATASATNPKVTFTKAAKDQWVEYGDLITWRLKLDCGSYYKIKRYGADFFRSSFTMHISNDYGAEKKIGEYNFSSKYRKDFSMETYRHPDIIKRTAYPMRYRITLRTYYKTTYMGFYTWKKCHTTKTYFWVY